MYFPAQREKLPEVQKPTESGKVDDLRWHSIVLSDIPFDIQELLCINKHIFT